MMVEKCKKLYIYIIQSDASPCLRQGTRALAAKINGGSSELSIHVKHCHSFTLITFVDSCLGDPHFYSQKAYSFQLHTLSI